MKSLIALLLITVCSVSHARLSSFIAGAVGGAVGTAAMNAVASDSGSQQKPVVISSDTHDVIICTKSYLDLLCKANAPKPLTPAEYAVKSGYRIVHKISAMIYHGNEYIVMEVSK